MVQSARWVANGVLFLTYALAMVGNRDAAVEVEMLCSIVWYRRCGIEAGLRFRRALMKRLTADGMAISLIWTIPYYRRHECSSVRNR